MPRPSPRQAACIAVLCGALTGFATGPAAAQTFTGKPQAIDGDSIALGGQTLHLYGLDAPEAGQFCTRADGAPWRCGQEAAFALARLLENHWAECRTRALDAAGVPLVVCRLGGPQGLDLNARLVAEGWAVAEPMPGSDYSMPESAAKAARRGIWQGAFEKPSHWRQGNP